MLTIHYSSLASTAFTPGAVERERRYANTFAPPLKLYMIRPHGLVFTFRTVYTHRQATWQTIHTTDTFRVPVFIGSTRT